MSHAKPKYLNHPGSGRRRFLQHGAAGIAAVAFPTVLTPSKTHAAGKLTFLAWVGNSEPAVVGAFEEANKVKIESKYYTGGENMIALIAQSPPGSFDVILSDAEYVTQLRSANYVEKLDADDYPFDDFFPEFQKFPVPGFWEGNDLFAVPVSFGFLGVSYNTQHVSAKMAESYSLLWNAKVKGKVGHFDWYLPSLGCLSLYNGNSSPNPYDISNAAFAKLRETALSLRPQVKGFFDYGGMLSSLKRGEVHAMCGIGDWITGVLEKDGAPVTTVVPREGGIQFTEGLCIGKNSKNPEMAKKFVQYMTSPRGQVRKALAKAYPTAVPNFRAWKLLNRENPAEAKRAKMNLSDRNMMHDIREGRIHYRQLPVRQSQEEWNDLWLEYKNA